ncbi:sensor histidine kinase [Mammaliicoccus sciuri]|uniref:sensor histidine kinase n=1 Tax=Mammaliicoccus sciuri TaxID=1296 RepID=UPI001D0D235D|nr:sensor histidine kinase [Mammaliicoccus sciuri]MCC2088679.1 sensor histidine kinase [Mammaliicoccus sciuri]
MNILYKMKQNPIGMANLVYLIFPILSLTVLGYKGPMWSGIVVTALFGITYLWMIVGEMSEKPVLRKCLLLIHLCGILYFVHFFSAYHFYFFFFCAYMLPYVFKVKFKSIEVYMYLTFFILCTLVVMIDDGRFLFIVIPLLVVILAITFGNFKSLETKKLQEEIHHQNEHINTLIAEQERNRIGQDLHDTLGHVFASLSIKSELAMKLVDKDIDKAKEEMASVNELSKEALVKVRAIVDDLKLQSFEEEVKTMETLLENANLSFEFKNADRAQSLSPTRQSALSMILREAVNNVIKHAQATKVTGEIVEENEHLTLVIIDDGIGMKHIDEDDFKSIKNRVHALNGQLKVSNLNKGLKMTITLPRGDDTL